jgi:uncharacterized membrane protein
MKLSIEQLSKLTKLSIPTLRVYVSRQKLGIKQGNRRVFSQSDVQKLLKDSKKAPVARKTKTAPKKTTAGPKKAGNPPVNKPARKPAATNAKPSAPAVKSVRPSIWSRLFGARKQKQKVGLLDAKVTK